MSFPGSGNVSDTVELVPSLRCRVEAPDVVEPLEAVGTAEASIVCQRAQLVATGAQLDSQIHLVVERNHRVVCPGRGNHGRGFTLREHLPAIIGHLQLVQVERRKIIHEEAFNLAAKDEDLGPQNRERVAVSSGGPGTRR